MAPAERQAGKRRQLSETLNLMCTNFARATAARVRDAGAHRPESAVQRCLSPSMGPRRGRRRHPRGGSQAGPASWRAPRQQRDRQRRHPSSASAASSWASASAGQPAWRLSLGQMRAHQTCRTSFSRPSSNRRAAHDGFTRALVAGRCVIRHVALPWCSLAFLLKRAAAAVG